MPLVGSEVKMLTKKDTKKRDFGFMVSSPAKKFKVCMICGVWSICCLSMCVCAVWRVVYFRRVSVYNIYVSFCSITIKANNIVLSCRR